MDTTKPGIWVVFLGEEDTVVEEEVASRPGKKISDSPREEDA